MFRFMITELEYPAEAKEARQQGRVEVQFTVGTDGKVSNPTVVRSVCESLDREAVRIVSSMPAWTPGYSDGKAVACTMLIPVQFQRNHMQYINMVFRLDLKC